MTYKEQLNLWAKGIPVHNPESDECCPDFSCCSPELLQPENVRKQFVKAHEEGNTALVHEYLGQFLVDMFAGKPVYVANMQIPEGQA